MQKQKRGLWLFLFSLIPGAGEMYMGFKKQGVSIMTLFFGIFALGAVTQMDFLVFLAPIIWFYSFFNVHNLKSLSEEEFYSVEDNYVLHLDQVLDGTGGILKKHRTLVSVLLIIFGISILWNNFTDLLYWILPSALAEFFDAFSYRLPQIVIGVLIILAGLYLLADRDKAKGDKSESGAPRSREQDRPQSYRSYRPYQRQEAPREDSTQNAAYSPFYMPTENPRRTGGNEASNASGAPFQARQEADSAAASGTSLHTGRETSSGSSSDSPLQEESTASAASTPFPSQTGGRPEVSFDTSDAPAAPDAPNPFSDNNSPV